MNKLFEKIRLLLNTEKYRHVLLFSMVGVLNTAVDYSVFSLLNGLLGLHYVICQIAGYSAGTLNSFILNKSVTFRNREKGKRTAAQFTRFVALNLLSLGISLCLLKLFIDIWGINPYISKAVTTVFTLIVNFLGSKFWIFKRGRA